MSPAVTLYVGNLGSSVTSKELSYHFHDHAPDCYVNFCVIVKDSQIDKSLGYGFVEFDNHNEG